MQIVRAKILTDCGKCGVAIGGLAGIAWGGRDREVCYGDGRKEHYGNGTKGVGARDLLAGQGIRFSSQGERERHLGAVIDISEKGIGISASTRFPRGTILEVELEDERQNSYLIGEVRWCAADRQFQDTYNIGVLTHIRWTM